MALEAILAPFKAIDHQIHKPIAKYIQKKESEGKDPVNYAIACHPGGWLLTTLAATTIAAFLDPAPSQTQETANQIQHVCNYKCLIESIGDTLITAASALDLVNNLSKYTMGVDPMKVKNSDNSINPRPYILRKFARIARLPVLGYGLPHVFEGIKQASEGNTGAAVGNLVLSGVYIGPAISMYIKDLDPKAMKKDTLFEKVKKYAQSLKPQEGYATRAYQLAHSINF